MDVRLKRTCVGSNGILECQILSENAHRAAGVLMAGSRATLLASLMQAQLPSVQSAGCVAEFMVNNALCERMLMLAQLPSVCLGTIRVAIVRAKGHTPRRMLLAHTHVGLQPQQHRESPKRAGGGGEGGTNQ
jgi:hypothetical protein